MGLKHMLKRTAIPSKDLDIESLYSDDKALPSKTPIPTPATQEKESTFGTNAVIKTFYQNTKKGWVETPPKQTSSKTTKVYDRVAIKVYKKADPTKPIVDGKSALYISAVDIQSPVLVAALKDIFKPLGTFLEVHETASLTAPFKPLYFGYDSIIDLYDRTYNDTVLKDHLHLLKELLNELFGETMTRLRHLRESGLICYDLAWTYFPTGSIVYCGAKDCERLYRVIDTAYDGKKSCGVMTVSCQELAFNGTKFEWKSTSVDIQAFAGNVPISGLRDYPLSFHKNPEQVKALLTERGKSVLEYQELKHREYVGVGISDDHHIKKHNVSGRILIDYLGYQKHSKGLQRQSEVPDDSKSSYIEPLSQKKQEKNKTTWLARPHDLIFMSPMLAGFALKDKVWLRFYIDDIKPVSWNEEAYKHLVYPEEQKDLVLTFVKNHQQMKEGLDDVIVGKGQGLVTLLSGPPGTGKTLLAEAVADKARRPLYYLQAEELGTNAGTLGKNVKKVFEMAAEWNAVILLDEADVFMAERSPSDVLRNELVSIFLRELEYFQGIIFLTTNLLSTIDNAFRSRVNIHLLFSPLSISSRLQLWQKSLSRLPSSADNNTYHDEHPVIQLTNLDMQQLAMWDLNGREIKNTIKTVRAWCVFKGSKMDLERLESGIAVTAPQARKVDGGGVAIARASRA